MSEVVWWHVVVVVGLAPSQLVGGREGRRVVGGGRRGFGHLTPPLPFNL